VTLVDLDRDDQAAVGYTSCSAQPGVAQDPKLHVSTRRDGVDCPDEETSTWVVDFPDRQLLARQALHHALLQPAQGPLAPESGVVQSTSPLFARQSYWCIGRHDSRRRLSNQAYHVWVRASASGATCSPRPSRSWSSTRCPMT